ncbi:hypothetical protein ACLOJK_037573 [Asimina triloba]
MTAFWRGQEVGVGEATRATEEALWRHCGALVAAAETEMTLRGGRGAGVAKIVALQGGRIAEVEVATTAIGVTFREGRGVVVAATGAEEALRRCQCVGEAAATAKTTLREGRGAVAAVESVGQFSPTANVMAMGEKLMWQYICHVIDMETWMKRCEIAESKDLWSLRANPPPNTNPKASTVDMVPAKRNTSCSVSSKSQKRY